MTHKYLTGMAYAALLTVLGFIPVVSAAVEAMVITSGCQGKSNRIKLEINQPGM